MRMILNEDYFTDNTIDISDEYAPEISTDDGSPYIVFSITLEEDSDDSLYPEENENFCKRVRELPFVKSLDVLEEREH